MWLVYLQNNLIAVMIGYLIAVILISGILPYTLRNHFQPIQWFLFSLICNVIAPIMGLFFTIIFTIYLYRTRYRGRHIETEHIRPPIFHAEKPVTISLMDIAQSATYNLKSDTLVSPERKLEALMSYNQTTSPETNLINQAMMQETIDELRLYAYGKLNKQQTDLYEQIYELETLYKQKPRPILLQMLASCYWSLAYYHLIDDDLKEGTLESCRYYRDQCLKAAPESIHTHLLTAKIALLEHDQASAEKSLRLAAKLGAPQHDTLLKMAELNFQQRRFDQTHKLMQAMDASFTPPSMHDLLRFWREDMEQAHE